MSEQPQTEQKITAEGLLLSAINNPNTAYSNLFNIILGRLENLEKGIASELAEIKDRLGVLESKAAKADK